MTFKIGLNSDTFTVKVFNLSYNVNRQLSKVINCELSVSIASIDAYNKIVSYVNNTYSVTLFEVLTPSVNLLTKTCGVAGLSPVVTLVGINLVQYQKTETTELTCTLQIAIELS